jgi:hypothetical protein
MYPLHTSACTPCLLCVTTHTVGRQPCLHVQHVVWCTQPSPALTSPHQPSPALTSPHPLAASQCLHSPAPAKCISLSAGKASKGASADCAASDGAEPQQDAAVDALVAATSNGTHSLQQPSGGSGAAKELRVQQAAAAAATMMQQQHISPHTVSLDSCATCAWPQQPVGGVSAEGTDGATSKEEPLHHQQQQQQQQQPRKQAKQADATSPGGTGTATDGNLTNGLAATAVTSSAAAAATAAVGAAAAAAAAAAEAAAAQDDGPGSSDAADSATSEHDALRREWEALLEQAARCREPRLQPGMLDRCVRLVCC